MFELQEGLSRARPEGAREHRLPRALEAIIKKADTFGREEKGSVAILFALTTFVVFSLVGGAIDYGRALTVRDQLQNSVDAAVLAGARVWQTENDIALAQSKAQQHFNATKPYGIEANVTGFTPDYTRNAIVMKAEARVPAPFLSAAYSIGNTTRGLPTADATNIVSAQSEALLAVGGNGDKSLEISMMLDVTGSMSGDKIADLKEAAKDLIDIVVWADQSEFTSKVALVPFANSVHLGSMALVNEVRGAEKSGSCLTNSSSVSCTYTSGTPSSTQWTWGAPARWTKFTNTSGNETRFRVSQYCVTERIGTDRYTDAAPNTAARKVGPLYQSNNNNTSDNNRCTLVNTSDLEENSIQPLSNDKTMLKRRIDKLTVDGTTAGQLGTAWAWYMLSPNWAYLWPEANRPRPYNTDKLQKIVILMTDGEYNTAHCNGVLSSNSINSGTRINCTASNGTSDPQADSLCTAMKNPALGITVYSVGFALGGNTTAINTLRDCASDPSKFYNAEDGAALRLAFRDIALQLAKLRLSQ